MRGMRLKTILILFSIYLSCLVYLSYKAYNQMTLMQTHVEQTIEKKDATNE